MSSEQDASLAPEDFSALFERMKVATEVERESILSELCQRAEKSDSADGWNHLAMALQAAGRRGEALNLLEELVQTYPEVDRYRINLATSYSLAHQFEMSKYQLKYIIEHGSNKEMRERGKKQLEELERSFEETEGDQRFRQLQIDSLRERIALRQGNADDYLRLGRLLFRMEQRSSEGVSIDEVISVLEEGREHFPDAVKLLEYQVYVYLRKGSNSHLEEILKTLEKVAPDSPTLQAFDDLDESTASMRYEQDLLLVYGLVTKTQSDDPELQAAAVQDIQKMIMLYPSDLVFLRMYALALARVGQNLEAIKQAELLLTNAGDSFDVHFDLGQIFWLCHDPDRGKYHFDLALKYAENDEERQEAMERIAYWSGR